MDMADHIRIRKADGVWTVRSGGAVIGESRDALELTEGDYPAVIYFPRDDIAMAFLDRTDKVTHCPHKGDANYYTIVNRSARVENAVWTYEDPKPDLARIKDHLAFYSSDMVTVEQI
jgi:uncharacterized protein (DUF427 family)